MHMHDSRPYAVCHWSPSPEWRKAGGFRGAVLMCDYHACARQRGNGPASAPGDMKPGGACYGLEWLWREGFTNMSQWGSLQNIVPWSPLATALDWNMLFLLLVTIFSKWRQTNGMEPICFIFAFILTLQWPYLLPNLENELSERKQCFFYFPKLNSSIVSLSSLPKVTKLCLFSPPFVMLNEELNDGKLLAVSGIQGLGCQLLCPFFCWLRDKFPRTTLRTACCSNITFINWFWTLSSSKHIQSGIVPWVKLLWPCIRVIRNLWNSPHLCLPVTGLL